MNFQQISKDTQIHLVSKTNPNSLILPENPTIKMNLLRTLTILVLLTQVSASSNQNYYQKKLRKEQIQISTTPDISTIHIYQCKCEIEQIIYHCSQSGRQIESIEKYSTIKELSRDECLTIHSN